MSENKKLNDMETENVVGGVSENEVGEKKNINLLGGRRKNTICKVCGRQFEELIYDWGGTGELAEEHMHYSRMCDECKKKNPYKSLSERLKERLNLDK